MDYRLIVLTHGPADTLRRTLASFAEHVRPLPAQAFLHVDGALDEALVVACAALPATQWISDAARKPLGFCGAAAAAWTEASKDRAEESESTDEDERFIFWLEHDFRFTRDVDLRELAVVLGRHPMLAQMALMRDAVNETEKAAGGLFESRPDQYVQRAANSESTAENERAGVGESTDFTERLLWLEHLAYFTTNPSLMRRDFMAENPWPAYESECEGRFGIDLVERGYTFGAWGSGEPWVEHIGARTGFGY